jgi:hypothetical protein
MNQDGFLGAFDENDQSIGLRSRQFAPRGHSEVDMGNAESTRFANLRVVPGASGIIATQINDRLDAVLLGVLGDLRRRQLPRPVELRSDNGVEVPRHLKRAQIPAAEHEPEKYCDREVAGNRFILTWKGEGLNTRYPFGTPAPMRKMTDPE